MNKFTPQTQKQPSSRLALAALLPLLNEADVRSELEAFLSSTSKEITQSRLDKAGLRRIRLYKSATEAHFIAADVGSKKNLESRLFFDVGNRPGDKADDGFLISPYERIETVSVAGIQKKPANYERS